MGQGLLLSRCVANKRGHGAPAVQHRQAQDQHALAAAHPSPCTQLQNPGGERGRAQRRHNNTDPHPKQPQPLFATRHRATAGHQAGHRSSSALTFGALGDMPELLAQLPQVPLRPDRHLGWGGRHCARGGRCGLDLKKLAVGRYLSRICLKDMPRRGARSRSRCFLVTTTQHARPARSAHALLAMTLDGGVPVNILTTLACTVGVIGMAALALLRR